MQRRTLLKLGAVSAGVFALLGAAVSSLHPGIRNGRLTTEGRVVLLALAGAMLEGSLPTQPAAREVALDGLFSRLDDLVAGLPDHVRGELSELLTLLYSPPGRRLLAGLAEPWPEASVSALQTALQSMRFSGLALRRQAYQALHDLIGGAYFSDPTTWARLGYPGPIDI